MYDVNPLGPMMHLKELERQAILAGRKGSPGARTAFRRLTVLLQRVRAICWPAILRARRQ